MVRVVGLAQIFWACKTIGNMRFNSDRLREFVEEAFRTNVSYFAVRRRLFDLFTAAMSPGLGNVDVPPQIFIVMRTFLTSRDRDNDSARLAFEVALVSVLELLPSQ